MTFARKRIDVTITLGSGKFGETVGDTVTLTGHRVIADVVTVPGGMQPTANVKIYGLTLSDINRLTTTGATMTAIRIKNRISIAAGDDGGALSLIYSGVIDQAWGDFQAAPDVCLNLTALAALDAAIKPVGASSYNDPAADVATIMKKLAELAGYSFENHGVNVKLSYPYFPGSAYDQIKSCARAARINFVVEDQKLIIWPQDGVRTAESAVISPATGMVGYPIFSSSGVNVVTAFKPTARVGSTMEIESSILSASGKWNIFGVQHSLESERPGGAWFTYISGNKGI